MKWRVLLLIATATTIGGAMLWIAMKANQPAVGLEEQVTPDVPSLEIPSRSGPEITVLRYIDLSWSNDKAGLSELICGYPDSAYPPSLENRRILPPGEVREPSRVARDYLLEVFPDRFRSDCEFRGIESATTVGNDARVFVSERCFEQFEGTVTFMLTIEKGKWKIFTIRTGRNESFF